MAEHLRLCPSGHPADIPQTNDADDSWICACDDPGCCWKYEGNELSREQAVAGWNHRVPGPATKAMLAYARTITETAREIDRGQGFKPDVLKMVQDMEAFLAEWLDPATSPTPEQPQPSPWKCCVCDEPVRIADDMMPRHIREDTGRTHAAELSDEDMQILVDGLKLTD